MKKLLFCFMIATIGARGVDTSFDFMNVLKDRSTQVLLLTTVGALSVFSYMREPNAIKIKKALKAKDAMQRISSLLKIDADEQDSLLQNIQVLGFDKSNGLSALTTLEKHQAAMQVVVDRYESMLTPWNKTYDMQQTVANIASALETCNMYCVYFKKHKDCLRGWELVHRYERAEFGNILNVDSAMSAISIWYKNNDSCNLIKSVELLLLDLEYIKSCLSRQSFKQSYPDLYEQLYYYLPALEIVKNLVVGSCEYKTQCFCKNHKQTPSVSKKNDNIDKVVASEKTSVQQEKISATEYEDTYKPLIEKINPFNNYSTDQE